MVLSGALPGREEEQAPDEEGGARAREYDPKAQGRVAKEAEKNIEAFQARLVASTSTASEILAGRLGRPSGDDAIEGTGEKDDSEEGYKKAKTPCLR